MKHNTITDAERKQIVQEADMKLQMSNCRARMVNNHSLAISHYNDIVKIVAETGYQTFDEVKQKFIDQTPYCISEVFYLTVLDFMKGSKFDKMSDAEKLEFANYHLDGITRAAVRLSHIRAVLVTTLDIDVEKQMSYAPMLVYRTKPQLH